MDEPTDNRQQQQETTADPSASQTSKRRVADVGEIEELQWEADRRRRKRRRSLIMVWGLLALVAAVAIYVVAARSLVVNARQRYREVYRGMDLSVYRAFNSAGLRQAEQAYRETETMNPYLQTPAILSTADQALQTLRNNYEKAQEKESRFGKLRETYNVRRQEAQQVGLPELLPEQWARLRELEKSFRSDLSPAGFDYKQAKNDVSEAIAILNSLRRQYADLREYARVRKLQQKTLEAMNPGAWRVNRPKLHARLESLRERAATYAENQEWGAATQALQQFQQLHEDHWREIADLRSAAEEQMTKAQDALTGNEAEAVRKVAEKQFAALSDKSRRMEQAFLEYRYEKVEKLAEQILADMQTLKEEVQTLKDSRESLMTQFQTLWDKIGDNQVVFRRNWPERWEEVISLERRIRMLEQDGARQIEFIQVLRQAVGKLKGIVELAREQAKSAIAKRRQFQELVENADLVLLDRNLPEVREKILQLRLTGQNWWNERMYSRAEKTYAQALETLQQAQTKLGQLRDRAETLRETAFEQLETYARGLEVFVPRTLEKAREHKQTVRDMLDDQRFGRAITELESLESLMPESRFAAQENGAVLDFVSGLMWAAVPEAGKTALDWYDALTFADNLRFADLPGWKLPTREELLTLRELSPEQRERLFPTFSEDAATFWTSENVAQGGTTAYAVTIPDFEILEAIKNQQNLVLPVRTPE